MPNESCSTLRAPFSQSRPAQRTEPAGGRAAVVAGDIAAPNTRIRGGCGVSMSSDVYNGHAHNRKAPAGPVAANSSAPSLVTVDAPTPALDPRVVTASRRKVVGVDCVERFLPI